MLNLKETKAAYKITDSNVIKALNAFDNIEASSQDFNRIINNLESVQVQIKVINSAIVAKKEAFDDEQAALFADAIKSRAKRKTLKWLDCPEGLTVGTKGGLYCLKKLSSKQQKPKKEANTASDKEPVANTASDKEPVNNTALSSAPEQEIISAAHTVQDMPAPELVRLLLERKDIADIMFMLDEKLLAKVS